MWRASCFVLLGTLFVMALARPTELEDIFGGYLKNINLYNPEKQSQTVKRRIYEDNPDESIKKVSLQSLIGDLEQNFFQSASSVGSFPHQTSESVETNSSIVENQPILKRKTENIEQVDKIVHREESERLDETTSPVLAEASTEKVSTKETGNTRIQVEHISVQPHYGDLPVVPAFQVHHTKLISATFKDSESNPTQITITKTNIQAAPLLENSQKIDGQKEDSKVQEENEKISDHTEESYDSNQHTTEQPELVLTTTARKSVAELKETEAELKEKVAEIEAEPVILSARV